MIVKASARSTLILATTLIFATGVGLCLAGPSQAAEGADDVTATSNSESVAGAPIALNKYTKRSARHSRKYAHHKSDNVELKSTAGKKDAAADVAADDANNSSALPSAIPASVANANARLASADTPVGSAKAMSARANNILQAAADTPAQVQPARDSQVVSADQLNDVDRALHESNPPAAATVAMAPAPAPVVTAASNESSTWDQTSLIGKIFIGFGALLTMASAARMFMA
jgi:hypothetical protein